MPTTSQGGTSKRKRNHTELEDTPSRKRILDYTPVQQVPALKPPSFKRTHLRIDIPSTDRAESPSSLFSALDTDVSPNSDPDSLFDEPNTITITDTIDLTVASRTAPSIPGLFFSSSSAYQLPQELADEVMSKCMDLYFTGRTANQVMLFGRATTTTTKTSSSSSTGLPPILITLLARLSEILLPLLPPETHSLLFPAPSSSSPPKARQAILNLYKPGEGISSHVDLLKRYGDGILGVSLGSGCVMGFKKHPDNNNTNPKNNESAVERHDLYLPERSVLVLSEDARYKWTHGIEGRMNDLVQNLDGGDTIYIARETRLSITFRWMLPGADLVGPDSIP